MGHEAILWLQSFSTPVLDAFWSSVSVLGDEMAYMVLLPIIYFAIDRPAGLRLGILFVGSILTVFILKGTFAMLRPGEAHPGIRVIRPEGGFTFPSGHAQGTATLWTFLALHFRRRWIAAAGAVIVLAVSISRVYLGVHYPRDVIAGAAIGAFLAWAAHRLSPAVTHFVKSQPMATQMALAAAVSLAPLLVHASPDTYKMCGYWLGVLAGAVIERRRIRFSAAGPLPQRAARAALGVVGMFALWAVSRRVFPSGDAFQLARYTLLGLWLTLIAPYLFSRLGLQGAPQTSPRANQG